MCLPGILLTARILHSVTDTISEMYSFVIALPHESRELGSGKNEGFRLISQVLGRAAA